MITRTIKGTNYEVTPDIERYLDERLAVLERAIYPDASVTCAVELEKETERAHGALWRAEVNLTVDGTLHRAEANAEGMNAAIDAVRDELIRQLRKDKGRHESLLRRGGAKVKEWLRFGRR